MNPNDKEILTYIPVVMMLAILSIGCYVVIRKITTRPTRIEWLGSPVYAAPANSSVIQSRTNIWIGLDEDHTVVWKVVK